MLELLSKMHLDEGGTLKKIFSPGFTLDWISTPGTMFLWLFRITGASQVALMVKNTPANAGDSKGLSWIPVSGRSPGVGNGNPLQYSYLGNPMDREAWRATVHRVAESDNSQTRLSN